MDNDINPDHTIHSPVDSDINPDYTIHSPVDNEATLTLITLHYSCACGDQTPVYSAYLSEHYGRLYEGEPIHCGNRQTSTAILCGRTEQRVKHSTSESIEYNTVDYYYIHIILHHCIMAKFSNRSSNYHQTVDNVLQYSLYRCVITHC